MNNIRNILDILEDIEDTEPQVGDIVEMECGDTLIETTIAEVTEDGVVLHLDETGVRILVDGAQALLEGKTGPGLRANIHAKRERGERMRKRGEEGAPTEKALKAARAGSKNEGMEGVSEVSLIEFAPPGSDGDGENERSRRIRKLLEIAKEVAKEKKVGKLSMVHAMNMIAGDDFFKVAVEGLLPDITDHEYKFVLQTAYKTVKQGEQGVAEGIARGPKEKKLFELLNTWHYFISFKSMHIARTADSQDGARELSNMAKHYLGPVMNGMTFGEIMKSDLWQNPKVIPHLLKYIYQGIPYIEERIKKFVKSSDQSSYLSGIDKIKQLYKEVVAQYSQGVAEAHIPREPEPPLDPPEAKDDERDEDWEYEQYRQEKLDNEDDDDDDRKERSDEAKYRGREVPLGKPMAGDVAKSKVYVKGPKGNVVKVNFGQKGVKIKKNNPGRRKNFRARHNCDNPGPRWKAKYWSCRAW